MYKLTKFKQLWPKGLNNDLVEEDVLQTGALFT